ncbi:MAG: hypothetical protein IT326_01205 [Anaerolineae bacterium]|nr:hypothetical protein [Anaerolineae bacterium]
MPRLSTLMIRAALLHMGAGFLFGALMLFNKGLPVLPWLWRLLPLHIDIQLFGWMAQLAMGIAYWIFPRWDTNRRRPEMAWSAFVLINTGVLAVCTGYLLPGLNLLVLAGRLAEAAAVLAFALHTWPRIKPVALPPAVTHEEK